MAAGIARTTTAARQRRTRMGLPFGGLSPPTLCRAHSEEIRSSPQHFGGCSPMTSCSSRRTFWRPSGTGTGAVQPNGVHMRLKTRSLLGTLAGAAVLAGSLAVPAVASGPPNGQYECYSLGWWFKLKGNGHYTMQSGAPGKWSYNASSKKVIFKGGSQSFAYGKFRKDNTGAPVIDLYDKHDDSYYDNCPKT